MQCLDKSTANCDVIAKAALINFLAAISWLEKFTNNDKTKEQKNSIRVLIFNNLVTNTVKMAKEICSEYVLIKKV